MTKPSAPREQVEQQSTYLAGVTGDNDGVWRIILVMPPSHPPADLDLTDHVLEFP